MHVYFTWTQTHLRLLIMAKNFVFNCDHTIMVKMDSLNDLFTLKIMFQCISVCVHVSIIITLYYVIFSGVLLANPAVIIFLSAFVITVPNYNSSHSFVNTQLCLPLAMS